MIKIENVVTFPNLNLTFNLSQIAFDFLGINVYWYGIIIAIAYLICVILIRFNNNLYEINWSNIIEMSTLAIVFGVIGARIYYVLFQWKYYSKHIEQIINISNGGLGIYGAIIFGFIAICIYCKIKKVNLLNSLDYIVNILPLGQAIGRIGNFINIEAYGIETNTFLKMQVFDKIYNRYIFVHPTFLYESILTLIIFVLLYSQRHKRKIKGEQVLTYLLLYGLGRFVIEGLRADSLMLLNIKISQILSLILFILSLTILIVKNIKEKKKNIKTE